MCLLPHELSSGREKANQDSAEQPRRKLLVPGGVGGVLFLRSGENTELENNNHLCRTEEWPHPK